MTSTRVRVVHVVFAGERGGAERMLVDLASRPDATRADHAIALFSPSQDVADLFTGAGLRVHDRGRVRENPLTYLSMSLGKRDVAWAADVMKKERADVAHLHTFQSHVVGARAALAAGAKILRTEHDTRYFVDPSCAPFTRWSLRLADLVVACSSYVADFVTRTAPYAKEKTIAIRNGVDADRFTPRPELAPTDGDAFRFVVACRLEREKRVHLAIEALARIAGSDAPTLDVLGEGSQRAKLERLASELGVASRVTFHGHVKDPRDVIARADAAVSSSGREALGLSILEALAMKKPVVAFAVGGIPEILAHGETGWLVRDASVESLAAAMREASANRDRARKMGENGRRFVDASCRIESMCEAYGRAYAGVAARKISS